MRYRKRIKIAKGININLSKSGPSLSLGMRGASVTVGKQGVYGNAGIPGTGLYTRNKFSGSNQDSASKQYQSGLEVRFNIDENGKIIIKNKDGFEIEDEGLLKKIRRTDIYKQAAEQLYQRKYDEIQGESDKFINIYQFTEPIKNEDFWKKELDSLKHQEFIEEDYKVQKPTISDSEIELTGIARKKIRSILFWTNKTKRANYVSENLNEFHNRKVIKWEDNLANHKERERARQKEIENLNQEIDNKHNLINNYVLKGNESYIISAIAKRLKEIELPVEFSIDYDYNPQGYLLIDLNLPEIEHLPTTKAQILQSGKISIKNKTQNEIKQDYATCVCGLAFYFAGEFFNISPIIQKIIISGYTQRMSKNTGNIEDQYIYSLIFKRDIFQKLNIQNIDPIEALQNFESKIDKTASFELKTISPYGNVESK
jgi:hypothetical protein